MTLQISRYSPPASFEKIATRPQVASIGLQTKDTLHFQGDQTQTNPPVPFAERVIRIAVAGFYTLVSALFTVVPKPAKAWLESKMLFYPTEPIALTQKQKEHEIYFDTPSGTRLHGLYFKAQPNQPTLVFFNGNAGDLSVGLSVSRDAGWLKEGYGLMVYDYPGYGQSQGKPSEASFYESAQAAVDYLKAQGVSPQNQVAIGWSIGGGVAIDTATKNQLKGLVVGSSFKSIPAVFDDTRKALGVPEWLFPVSAKITQRFDSIAKINQVTCPTLFLHGEDDVIVPASHTKALQEKSGNKTAQQITYPHAGHDDILGRSDVLEDISTFIRQLEASSS